MNPVMRVGLLLTAFAALFLPAHATPPNVPVSGPLPGLQNEEQVWICPNDPSIIFANHRDFRLGYRQLGMARSTDGGLTWTDTLMATSYQIYNWQSDPVLTATSSGRLVHCYLDFRSTSPNYDSSFMAFLLSDDCGETWSGPYTTLPDQGPWFEDKQFLTSDRSGGLYDGNIYVSWTRFSNNNGYEPTRIMLCRSQAMFGGTFWDDTVIVGSVLNTSCFGTVDAGQFSQPLVGKDGAVYVFWQGYDIDSSAGCAWYQALRFNKSTDGGQTWQNERIIRRVDGWSSTSSGIDIYSQPVTDADLSNGPYAGNLYLQYRDTTKSPFTDRGDILFQRSLDTGNTWSAAVVVNDDSPSLNAEQFHNWMVVNDAGVIASIWYDTRLDPFKQLFDVFAAYSFDGGATWTSNERISSVSSDVGLLLSAMQQESRTVSPSAAHSPLSPMTPMAGLIAEYIGLAIHQNTLVAVWTDTRDGGQDVWSATWQLHLTEPRLMTPNGTTLGCGDSLRWATAWLETEDLYDLEIADDNTFATVDFSYSGITTRYLALPLAFPAGNWYWRVRAHNAPGGIPIETSSWSGPRQFTIPESCQPCACDCHGDPAPIGNCDGVPTVIDVVEAVNVAFRNAASILDPNPNCPVHTTDVDCNGVTTVIDVVKVINAAFRNANPAVEFCNPCL